MAAFLVGLANQIYLPMKPILEEWKEAVLRAEAAGLEVKELNDRITKNRRQWQDDRAAEYRTEIRARPAKPSPHDD